MIKTILSAVILLWAGTAYAAALPESLGDSLKPLTDDDGNVTAWLAADQQRGLQLLDARFKARAQISGQANLISVMPTGNKNIFYVASLWGAQATPSLFVVDRKRGDIHLLSKTPGLNFLPEALCLFRDADAATHLFVVDERGLAQQWLLADAEGKPRMQAIRTLMIPPNTTACDVSGESLALAEEAMGLWQYSANSERPAGRTPIALAVPYGNLAGGSEALAWVGQALIAVSAETQDVWLYVFETGAWKGRALGRWDEITEARQLTAWFNKKHRRIETLVKDDDSGRFYRADWPLPAAVASRHLAGAKIDALASVKPVMQTEPVMRFGDAADDPAVWVNNASPEESRVLGTDKKHGLAVYDLNGKQVQFLATGRLNNVDLRYGFNWGDELGDIAVASQRDTNSLSVYHVHPATGHVTHKAELPTGLNEIYGLCLYQQAGNTYAFANGKSGRFEQYLLQMKREKLTAEKVRSFAVGSQPEGCVADDGRQTLFVGEEGQGIWTLSADPAASVELVQVKTIDAELVADVEGLALYPATNSRYLIVSSQGDHSYLVLDSTAPFRMRGKFRIGANVAAGIDGVSETDGLEVTHLPLGKGLNGGALLVQDGHNVMPEAPQNFKLVPWDTIAETLGLE